MHRLTKLIALAAIAGSALLITTPARAQHLYAGVIDTNGTPGLQAGDALSFVNNTTGVAITGDSLGVQNMSLVTVGSQAGLYLNNAYTFTALSDGLNWTGSAYRAANPYAASKGTFVEVEITGISGPNGAQFSVWDSNVSSTAPIDSYTIGSGFTVGNGIWNLSDPTLIVGDGVTPNPTTVDGTSGIDPYGHIHGRSWTADTPGTYTVDYILHDENGVQADSAPFVVTYSAVPEPATCGLILIGLGSVVAARRRRNSITSN